MVKSMTDQLSMFREPTSEASLNATSLPASGDGPMHSDSQAGLTTGRCGPDHRPASHSATRAGRSARATTDILLHTSQTLLPMFGLPSSSESRSQARLYSDDLQSALEARLMESLNGHGSMIYSGAWKPHTTPAGRSIYRLRVSVRRTFGSAHFSEPSGWPTPQARDSFPAHSDKYIEAKKKLGHGMANLNDVAMVAGWPTPTAKLQAGGEYRDQDKAMARAMGPHANDLRDFAQMAGPARLTVTGEMLTGCTAGMESGGRLNPALPRWLMGYPAGWDDCAVTATPSSRKSRRNLSAQ